jgi:adenine-specific DNA methylase
MHNIYSYHAKFTPEIPNIFTREYSKENQTILDPFCGCGTTLLEGLKLNRNVIGIDLSPIGILCSKVKTSIYDFEEIKKYEKYVIDIDNAETKLPNFPNREIWFSEGVLDVLGKINYKIESIKEENYRNLFLLILLSILNNCSRKRSTWNLGYIADNVLPNIDRKTDPLKLYKQKINQLYKRKDFIKNVNNTVKCIESDVTLVHDVNNIDLVVTSPPYPFAVDFIRYHRIALYWLEKPVDELSKSEVGARNKRNKKNATEDFLNRWGKYIFIS